MTDSAYIKKYEFNQKLLNSIDDEYPLGLFYGKMGICIYFFQLSRDEDNDEYNIIAKDLLQNCINNLSLHHSIKVEDGLAGIGLGIIYLVNANYIEGNLNDILKEIDDVIFKKLSFPAYNYEYSSKDLLHILVYLYYRYIEQSDIDEKNIHENLIIKTVNKLYDNMDSIFFYEPYSISIYDYNTPLFLWITGQLLSANFYNVRLMRIIEELTPQILYKLPILNVNRLYLLTGILNLKSHLQNYHWNRFADLLYKEIRFDEIIENEMKNRNIFVNNGLSMVYILILYVNKSYPDIKIVYDPCKIYEGIINSDSWNALRNREYYYNIHRGLINGFPGVELIINHLEKYSL